MSKSLNKIVFLCKKYVTNLKYLGKIELVNMHKKIRERTLKFYLV